MILKDRVAVVTGGGKGIGRGIALLFAQEGANIVIPEIDIQAAQSVAKEIESLGRRALVVKTDVSKQDQVNQMVDKTVSELGRVDILINNAGMAQISPFLETSKEIWDTHINVHLNGTFYCTQAAAKEMAKQKWGRIVNIASIAGLAGPPFGVAAYSAAKGGMISLTRALAVELADYGIRVNAIAPGPIETELLKATFNKEQARERARSLPVFHLGEPEDIARAALFFCSPETDYITGQVLAVDGGFMAIGNYGFMVYSKRK